MEYKVATIVVTFNRKELLKYCLEAIVKQDYRPKKVYIIDNASTDGTDVWVKENGYNGTKNGIDFEYVRLEENIGGSGGFYFGMKIAHESEEKYDAFWVMDDDGVPDKKQLEELVKHLDRYDYLSPLVISKEDTTRCAFVDIPVEELKSYAQDGLIHNAANPFNGVLFSRKVVDKVGYPVREMFLWGDEINYERRCKKAGFIPAIVIDAIHIHPKDRQQKRKVLGGIIVDVEQDWKLYLCVRNGTFNNRTLSRFRHFAKEFWLSFIRYTYFYTIKEPSLRKLKMVYRGMVDGAKYDLSRLNEYKK